MNELLLERRRFEIEIYDFLVEIQIPDSFWNPVEVGLTQEYLQFNVITISDECSICFENFNSFSELYCCKKTMCDNCIQSWFSTSVRCPFCVQDLRNCLKK